jgi:XTP/dITP diphosphohydrolase
MLRFVTTNADKVREAREYLAGVAEVEGFDYDYTEVQSDDLADIAARGAEEAFRAAPGDDPVIVDDAGLFVDALDGFPGPYSAYVEDTLGVERVWRLAEAEENRRAAFRGVVAYCDGEGEERSSSGQTSGRSPRVRTETFEGSVQGIIVAPRGDGGFGYDPVFEHDGRTFAEMAVAEKNALSHRGRALAKLAEWLASRA